MGEELGVAGVEGFSGGTVGGGGWVGAEVDQSKDASVGGRKLQRVENIREGLPRAGEGMSGIGEGGGLAAGDISGTMGLTETSNGEKFGATGEHLTGAGRVGG